MLWWYIHIYPHEWLSLCDVIVRRRKIRVAPFLVYHLPITFCLSAKLGGLAAFVYIRSIIKFVLTRYSRHVNSFFSPFNKTPHHPTSVVFVVVVTFNSCTTPARQQLWNELSQICSSFRLLFSLLVFFHLSFFTFLICVIWVLPYYLLYFVWGI